MTSPTSGVAETPAQQWQSEMNELGKLPAGEAFMYLILVVFPTVDEFQGDQAKEYARDANQVAKDQDLASDMYAQYTQFGNDRQALVNLDTNSPDYNQDSANDMHDMNVCVQKAMDDAGQIDYDMHNAPVYKQLSQGSDGGSPFVQSIEDQMSTIFPADADGTHGWQDPNDENAESVTYSLWMSDWADAAPPNHYSGSNNSSNDIDPNPSGLEARTTAFQNIQEGFAGINNVVQQQVKAQKSNMSMAQSMVHMIDSNMVDLEKNIVNGTQVS